LDPVLFKKGGRVLWPDGKPVCAGSGKTLTRFYERYGQIMATLMANLNVDGIDPRDSSAGYLAAKMLRG
jgi:hypothetical protein